MTKKQQTTVVGFVLDETGSMMSVQQATISGFNEYIDTLKQQTGNVLLTLVQFNSQRVQTVHKALPIDQVPPLTPETYQPDHLTPLYDAVARTISDTAHSVAAMKDNPSVMIVIMTDGHENSSREFSRDTLFALIKEKESQGWTFAFLGANQDAWTVGESIGVGRANSVSYNAAQPTTALRAAAGATADYISADDEQRDVLRKRGHFRNSRDAAEYLKSRDEDKS